jgi:Uma2 family endonuclease
MQTLELDVEYDYEIERGKPMPSKNHALVQTNLVAYLVNKYEEKFASVTELSLELSEGNATPDVCIFESMDTDWLHDEIRITTPPITAIEIVSPSQGNADMIEKLDLYFGSGVKSYWLVIPTFKEVHVFSADYQRVTFLEGIVKDPITEIEIPLDKIFKGLGRSITQR